MEGIFSNHNDGSQTEKIYAVTGPASPCDLNPYDSRSSVIIAASVFASTRDGASPLGTDARDTTIGVYPGLGNGTYYLAVMTPNGNCAAKFSIQNGIFTGAIIEHWYVRWMIIRF